MSLILTTIYSVCTWPRRTWQRASHFCRHWATNIVIGMLFEIGIHLLPGNPLVVGAQNWALDGTMRFLAGLNFANRHAAPSLVLIDVDEATWRNELWSQKREPARAPRDRLLELINYAVQHGASYVVLDVFVDGAAGDDPEDAHFADEIEGLAPRLEEAHQHLLFVRSLREPLYDAGPYSPGARLAAQVRPSALDAVIARHPGRLHAVAPYFRPSQDGVLRDWQLWRVACRLDGGAGIGHWEVLPSVQLLIATLVRPHDAAQGAALPWEAAAPSESCVTTLPAFAREGPGTADDVLNGRVLNWLQTRGDLTGGAAIAAASGTDAIELTSRIFFTFYYPPQSSRVRRIQALQLIRSGFQGNDFGFGGGLVVIGQSFEAARDQHLTPFGPMPGAMVLINSIASMLDWQLLHPSPQWIECMAEIVSIVIVGFGFARFDYIVATCALFLTFVPLYLYMNYLLLNYAHVWLDFSVPLLGIWAHRSIASLCYYIKFRFARPGEQDRI